MHSLFLTCSNAAKDMLIAELWQAGTLGIVEHERLDGGLKLQAFFEQPFETEGAPFAAHHPQWQREDERDWQRSFEESWEPVLVGERFYLAPPWRDEPPPNGRLRLTVYPGMACGTGRHPATQLCIAAMERWVRPGSVVLDVGTGSGILTGAAVLLQARAAIGCDIDTDTIEIAAENLSKEGIQAPLFAGSLRSVRSGSIDALVANLNAITLNALATDIRRVLRPGGRALLAGFQENEPVHLELVQQDQLREGDWECRVLTKV